MQQVTLQYKVQTSKAGYRRIDQALLDMGHLYNALILHRKAATGRHKGRISLQLQNRALTQLRADDPIWETYSRRIMAETAKQANLAWNASRKAGARPLRAKNPHEHNILTLSEPSEQHLKVSNKGKTGTIHVKGLPNLRFMTDSRLPTGTQPRAITIVRKPRRFVVNLIFNRPQGPPAPAPNTPSASTPE